MSYSFHKIEFSITFPDGHTKEFITGSIADGILMEKTYAPGIVGVSEVEMITNGATGELAFPVTGKYKIQARMWVGNHLEGQPQSVYIRAEPLEIEVQEPVGVDAEAIQFFSSKEEIVQLLGEGSVAYCKRSRDAECFGRVSKFLDQHPNSAYTPAILWDVADSVATGMLNVSSRSQTAIGLYNTFLGRWPDHPVAPRVMYRLATALDAAGRKQEAVALVGRFETTFPGRKDLLDLMRMNILHVRPESVK